MKKTSFFSTNLLPLILCLVLGAGCTKAYKARHVLAAANRDFQAQKYDLAEAEYKASLSLAPRNPVAIRQLGFIYFEEGRQLSFVYLKKANELDNKNTEVQLKLAEVYVSAGKAKEALGLLASVVRSEPANEHALVLLVQLSPTNDLANLRQQMETQLREGGQGAAACHSALGWIDLRTGKIDDAEKEFQKAAALDPKLPTPQTGLAVIYSFHKDTNGLRQALKTAAELSPVRSNARLKYVDYEMKVGSKEKAEQLLLDITHQAPDYIPAWLYLMRFYYATHKYDDCKATIETILAKDNSPPNFEAMFESGTLAMTQNDMAKALSTFQKMDGIWRLPQIKYYLALAHLMNHEKRKAMANLNEALTLDPDYSPAMLLMAELDYREGIFTESITLLSRLIQKHPENAQAQLALADVYLAQQRPDSALKVYQKMAKIFSKNPEIPRRMGMVYTKMGDAAKEREAYEQSLAWAPNYVPALQNMTDLDILEKRFDEAHNRLTRLIEKNPKLAEPFLLQGKIYSYEGQTNQAEAAYSKAIEINPEQPAGYMALAQLYLDSHNEQQALDRLEALVSRTNDFSAMQEIAEIEQSKGQYDQARKDYEKLLAVAPNFLPALNNLAYIDSEFLNKVDKALEFAETARQLRPDDPNAADTLGWILYKKHQYARALTLIQESSEKQPNDPEVQMHLGMAYYMMEEEKPARICLQKAVAYSADFPGKDLARRRLEILDIDPMKATPEMIQKLQALVREDPQDPVPLSRLASIEEQRGEVQKAVESLQTLISINPEDWPAMVRLSRLYADRLNNPRKALDLAKSAHDMAPDESQASALLGELVFRNGDYPWALDLLKQAANQSSDPSVFYDLALADYAVGRVNDADAAMQKAMHSGESFPNLDQAKQFLALRAGVQDPAQAQAAGDLAQQILQKDPNNVPALMVKVSIAERKGAEDEAKQICEKVLSPSLYPFFAPAMRELSIIDSHSPQASDQNKAYELAEKARASMPDDLELAKTLGVLAYKRKDYNRSMPLLLAGAEKSKNPEVFYYLGMDYYKLNQRNDSKQALKHALDLGLVKDLAAQAQTVIKELK